MSRAGYCDDYDGDNWSHICWRGQVMSTIRGKNGQAFLRELLSALDAMPDKRLIAEDLQSPDGEVCALDSVGRARGIDLAALDPEDYNTLATTFGITHQLVREIENANDYQNYGSPEARWQAMRDWVVQNLRKS